MKAFIFIAITSLTYGCLIGRAGAQSYLQVGASYWERQALMCVFPALGTSFFSKLLLDRLQPCGDDDMTLLNGLF
jgi:hypothetical protein